MPGSLSLTLTGKRIYGKKEKMGLKTLWVKLKVRVINLLGGTAFLCDSCRYDYRSCSRPQRPNAVKCSAYKPRY